MSVRVSRSGPGLKDLKAQLKQISDSDVLIGIPADHTLRKADEMNNATLAFIQKNGSPANNIPARPFLKPSIRANNKIIAPHLAKAAQGVMENRPTEARRELEAAGLIAANGAKRWFTDPRNEWPPDAPATIEAKGSDKPLIDTGQLRRSITHVVRSTIGSFQAERQGEVESHAKPPESDTETVDASPAATVEGTAAEVVETAGEAALI